MGWAGSIFWGLNLEFGLELVGLFVAPIIQHPHPHNLPPPQPNIEIVGTGSDFAEIAEISLVEVEAAARNGKHLPDGYPEREGVFFMMDFGQAYRAWIDMAQTNCTCKVYVVCSPLGLRVGKTPFDWNVNGPSSNDNSDDSSNGDSDGSDGAKSGLARAVFGAFGGAQHCFLLLADDCDKDGRPVTQVINLGAKPRSDYLKTAMIFSSFQKVGEGCDMCNKVREVAKGYKAPPYRASGPNSNTFVRRVVDGAGLRNPFAGGGCAPAGWNFQK